MVLKVDKAGRVILPKPVRDRMGLSAGTDVELSERPEGLVLTPVTPKPSMVKVKGLWVHQGVAPKGFDWAQHAEQERERRNQEVWSR
jgi:AbrB family looped-hinge helix DNA binding protein